MCGAFGLHNCPAAVALSRTVIAGGTVTGEAALELLDALEASVKLQSHYAKLLNMHDGGKRLGFGSAAEWLRRLRELREQPASRREPR
jgi:hypothetical protein